MFSGSAILLQVLNGFHDGSDEIRPDLASDVGVRVRIPSKQNKIQCVRVSAEDAGPQPVN